MLKTLAPPDRESFQLPKATPDEARASSAQLLPIAIVRRKWIDEHAHTALFDGFIETPLSSGSRVFCGSPGERGAGMSLWQSQEWQNHGHLRSQRRSLPSSRDDRRAALSGAGRDGPRMTRVKRRWEPSVDRFGPQNARTLE